MKTTKMRSNKEDMKIEKSVVILGSGGCGKTCILHRIVTNNFSDAYIPTVFEDSVWFTCVKGREIVLLLKDTAGQEDYDRLISLAVSGADIIIFCYSVDERRSFEDIKNKYIHLIPEEECGNQFVLVGNKTDLRVKNKNFVSKEEGIALGAEIGAKWVFECSAKKNEGIREIFDTFAKWAYSDPSKKKKSDTWTKIKQFFSCGCYKSDVDIEPES